MKLRLAFPGVVIDVDVLADVKYVHATGSRWRSAREPGSVILSAWTCSSGSVLPLGTSRRWSEGTIVLTEIRGTGVRVDIIGEVGADKRHIPPSQSSPFARLRVLTCEGHHPCGAVVGRHRPVGPAGRRGSTSGTCHHRPLRHGSDTELPSGVLTRYDLERRVECIVHARCRTERRHRVRRGNRVLLLYDVFGFTLITTELYRCCTGWADARCGVGPPRGQSPRACTGT